jgi:hypothetical protein
MSLLRQRLRDIIRYQQKNEKKRVVVKMSHDRSTPSHQAAITDKAIQAALYRDHCNTVETPVMQTHNQSEHIEGARAREGECNGEADQRHC